MGVTEPSDDRDDCATANPVLVDDDRAGGSACDAATAAVTGVRR